MGNIFHAARDMAKSIARFPLKTDEACFDDLWSLESQAQDYTDDHNGMTADEIFAYKGRFKHPPSETEVRNFLKEATDKNFGFLKKIADPHNNGLPEPGFKSGKWLTVDNKYVIFSDHHMVEGTHRHGYFKTFGNSKLYQLALLDYSLKGFSLIENGDVEDLLVLDPKPDDIKNLKNINIKTEAGQTELRQIRKARRLKRLEVILDYYDKDTYKLYDSINLLFHKKNRFYRITGNHDDDLHKADFKSILRQQYADINVYDYIVLFDSAKQAKYIITHGHQFDEASCPQHAPFIGEIHSECLSWAYEGADRVWRWATHTKDWVQKLQPFNNALVTNESRENKVHDIGLDAFFRLGSDNRIPCSAIKKLLKESEVEGWFEEKLGTNIAFEYLLGQNAYDKVCQVLEQREFFKFRHTNELYLREKLDEKFAKEANYPTLVLGHTHEVRQNPIYMTMKIGTVPEVKAFAKYANTGSAGRFENLIWALEIDHGQMTSVAWYFEDGPNGSHPRKLIYKPQSTTLVPSKA